MCRVGRLAGGWPRISAALSAAALLAGCAGVDGSLSSRPLHNTYGAARGDVASATWDLPYGEPDTLDPANGVNFSATFVTTQLCDTLLRYGPNYSIHPDLATETQVNPLTVVFKLRKGVRFWDGREMTSADVVYSLDHAFSIDSAIGLLFTTVKSVVATGRYQVTVHFKTPDELFAKEMADVASTIFEKAQAVRAGGEFGTAQRGLMCSGPYELVKWTPGTNIQLRANPDYWDRARAAHIKSVTMEFNTDSTSVSESLISGQFDGAYEVPAQDVPRLSAATNGRLLYGFAPIFVSLLPMHDGGPMANVEIRKALFTSIDRKALAQVVFNGAATPNYTMLNTRTWDPTALPVYEKAYGPFATAGPRWGSSSVLAQDRKLVAHSGYKGEPLTLVSLAGDAVLDETAELIQQEAQQIGLNIQIKELQPLLYATVATTPLEQKKYSLYLDETFNAAADPLEPLALYLLPGSVFNYLGYSNPTVARLLKTARRTFSSTKRARLIVAAQAIYEKQWLGSTLLNVDEISFLNDRLTGLETSFPYMLTPSLWSVGAGK